MRVSWVGDPTWPLWDPQRERDMLVSLPLLCQRVYGAVCVSAALSTCSQKSFTLLQSYACWQAATATRFPSKETLSHLNSVRATRIVNNIFVPSAGMWLDGANLYITKKYLTLNYIWIFIGLYFIELLRSSTILECVRLVPYDYTVACVKWGLHGVLFSNIIWRIQSDTQGFWD